MKFFLDSAIVDEIKYALDMWDIDGVTTNPRHVQVSGKPFMQAIHEIAEIFAGTDKPVSVEVNPHFDNWQ
ncbi:MAG: transaldolase, partial [Chloroflexi bacterium]